MAQHWYQSLRAALDAAVRGDAAAAGRVRAELEARPVLGPFAVHEMRRLMAGGGSGGSPQRSRADAARVLQVVCLVALESRKTMEALLASMRAEADAAPMGCVGEGALWSAMALVDWGVKLVVAAYFVARLGAPTSRDARPSSGGRVTDGPSARDHFERGEAEANAHGLELVAQMVEVAVSAANAESALLEDAGGSGGRAVCAAVAALSANAGLLGLSATTCAVLQVLYARMDGKNAGDDARAAPRSWEWHALLRSSSAALRQQVNAFYIIIIHIYYDYQLLDINVLARMRANRMKPWWSSIIALCASTMPASRAIAARAVSSMNGAA